MYFKNSLVLIDQLIKPHCVIITSNYQDIFLLMVQKKRNEFFLLVSLSSRFNFINTRMSYNFKCTKSFLPSIISEQIYFLLESVYLLVYALIQAKCVYLVHCTIAFREFKIKAYLTHFILLIHYSLFGYGDQVCFLLGWGVMNRLTTLTCVTFIWSHNEMSGNPCNLFCRKLVLTEKNMLH